MTNLKKYLRFCKIFHNYKFPKIKFKELNDWYRYLYRNKFNIDEDDINKASFVIFSLFFFISIILSLFFTPFSILIIIFYSLVLSLLASYRFNSHLYKKIKKEESILNALLYLIIINFSLIKKTLKINTDYSINFIELIKNYNLPVSESCKIILRKIHEGYTPEKELLKIVTPSEDFNHYLRDLIINDFNTDYEFQNLDDNTSERNFKVVLRDIESKISIVFFIGFFFPIGLCFLILFQQINTILIILFIPFFLILLNFLFRKLIRINILLIGLLKEYSNKEKRKFDEFQIFLKNFAINLKSNISPEIAFTNAYLQNKKFYKILNKSFEPQISRLLNFSCSFGEILNLLKDELKSLRYIIILDVIERMLDENSYYSADKVIEILEIISKHRRLEKKLTIIIKGEKFKVLIFIFLLPIIIGSIGGMIPLFIMLTKNIDQLESFSYNDYIELINLLDLIVIFLTLFFSNLITCYYFLKIINFEKKILINLISSIVYILSFFISFMNVIMLF